MIYFFTKGTAVAGSSRHRAYNIVEYLNLNGVKAVVVSPPVFQKNENKIIAKINYLKLILSLRSKDIVILQTTIFNRLFIVLIIIVKNFFNPRIIFDFDDAIYIKNPIATKILVKISNKVIVASHYLSEWNYIQNKQVMIVPNLIKYELSQKYTVIYEKKEKVVVGWIGGGPASMHNIEILAPVFEVLVKKGLRYKFRFVGSLGSKKVYNLFNKIDGLDVEFIDKLDWGKKGEIQKTNQCFDIGLNPLIKSKDNMARCSLKVLDYMAVGLPVVASNIGENNYFIDNGKNGFLVKNKIEWVEILSRLILNNELRKTIGQNAQERIKNHYSYESIMGDYIRFIN